MLAFENDYSEGAHPAIVDAFVKTNMIQQPGYGTDIYTEKAIASIKEAIKCEEAQIHLLTGGTQTNKLVIQSMLKPYEGVIAVSTGHVSVHEAGAIELGGHKVLEVPHEQGKLKAQVLQQYLETFYADQNHEHMVFPGMVYISYPTEYGTLYSKKELEELHQICEAYQIPLYMDGARLGYGLMSDGCDMTLEDIAKLTDIFYIGGTKIGALCGEALIFTKNNAPAHFMTIIKQNGALMAKGRVLGVQFMTLFTDGLYEKISRHAIDMAQLVKEILKEKGYSFYIESPTNQIFVILNNDKMQELEKEVRFSFWEKYDESHTVVRFATSWATRTEDIEALKNLL